MRLIFATGNKGKMNEIREIMSDSVPVLSMAEAGVSTDVEEDGNSFMENSFIKALQLVYHLILIVSLIYIMISKT